MASRRLFSLILPLVFVTGTAGAEEPASASSSTLKLTVIPAPTGPWTLRLENKGELPMRVAADPRLLSLEITPPSADLELDKKTKAPLAPPKCELPADARPTTDEGHELVIPASRSWSTQIDPLFYCFTARERAALVANATVKATFGWKAPAAAKGKTAPAPSPPFAASPIGAAVGKIAPQKTLESDPITLKDAIVLTAPVPAGETPAEAPKVFLTLPETMDAAKGSELSTTVTLVNDSDRAITTMFRPDMIQFGVSGPGGFVGCGSPRSIGSPMRELMITLSPRGRTSLSVQFTETCGDGTFDLPGLYRMSARFDTTGASGRALDIKTWDDVAVTKAPLLLRIRQPARPTPPARPTLD